MDNRIEDSDEGAFCKWKPMCYLDYHLHGLPGHAWGILTEQFPVEYRDETVCDWIYILLIFRVPKYLQLFLNWVCSLLIPVVSPSLKVAPGTNFIQ